MNPILLEIPAELTTPRLLLRAAQAGDGPMVLDAVRPSLAELKPYMPWAKDEYGLDDAETWCREDAAQFIKREALAYLISLRDGGPVLGTVSAFRIDWQLPKGEIGYWLRTDQTGHGYMTEAVRALADLLFEQFKFHRLEIRCDDRNLRSGRVAELSGFALDAVFRNDRRTRDGQLGHSRIYSRTSGD